MKPTGTMDALYRQLVEGITGYAIYMLKPDGTIDNWNVGAQKSKGYTAAEIIGKNFSCFFTEQDQREGLPQAILRKASIEGRVEGEGWRVRKDGTLLWAHVTVDAIRSEDGALIGFAKTCQDITKQHEQQKALIEQDRHLHMLVQSVTDYAIYMLHLDGTVSTWNDGAEQMYGYPAEEVVGRHFSQFYTQEDYDGGLPWTSLEQVAGHGKFDGESWRRRKDGSLLWVHVLIDRVHDEDGKLIGYAKITHDLTEAKHKSDELRKAKQNLDLALSNMSQGLCLFDSSEKLVLCNQRFYELLHLQKDQIVPGMSYTEILETVQQKTDAAGRANRFSRPGPVSRLPCIAAGQTAVSEEIWRGRSVSVNHRRLSDAGWVSTIDDITDRKESENRILRLAHFDTLTNLPNRSSFRNAMEESLRQRKRCALIYLDLDRFKPINDSLGHHIGDKVLQVVAQRISRHLRRQDVAGRQGGDEFAVLLRDLDREDTAIMVAERLIREIVRPVRINDEEEVSVGASAGIAFSGNDGTEAETLLRNADLALYAAKEGGRGKHCIYEPGMERVLLERQQLELDIRMALSQNEFALHYQPVIDVPTSLVTGYEALLRWTSPTRGAVSPVDFIPFAEEHGLMPKISEWVLRTACTEAASWNNDCCIAVNLSPSQFNAQDMVETVLSILEETGLPPHRLELEITETAMLDDIAGARVVLEELRSHGILIALDDFGTGYSSLSFLRSLPFTRIKIDKSFVQDLGQTQEALAIVRAVSGICKSLGVSLTGEGVETEAQLNILQDEGCHQVQGYLLGRPSAVAPSIDAGTPVLPCYETEGEMTLQAS